MKALRIYAGPLARQHIARQGLAAGDVRVMAAAAGGPKGLILGPLDRFIFGEWLAAGGHTVDLVGASIGAWRMATACLDDAPAAFARLEHDYIHQHYELPAGQQRPSADQVSREFGANLGAFFGGRLAEVLGHPRWRLHILASRGRGLLHREGPVRTPLGYAGAFVSNALHRRALGLWLERAVFSSAGAGLARGLPFSSTDYPTRQLALQADNFMPALQASCSIPFVLRAVQDIPGAPAGAYWDGGITDYHLHLDYQAGGGDASGLVLYPHFQQALVPGWLDKTLRWRHGATACLDRCVVLAPDPLWVRSLPNGKLPDRTDFTRYGANLAARVKAWTQAVGQAAQLAEDWQSWLQRGCPADQVRAL